MTFEESSVTPVAPNEFTIRVGKKALTKEQLVKLEQLIKSFDFARNNDLQQGGKGELAARCQPVSGGCLLRGCGGFFCRITTG